MILCFNFSITASNLFFQMLYFFSNFSQLVFSPFLQFPFNHSVFPRFFLDFALPTLCPFQSVVSSARPFLVLLSCNFPSTSNATAQSRFLVCIMSYVLYGMTVFIFGVAIYIILLSTHLIFMGIFSFRARSLNLLMIPHPQWIVQYCFIRPLIDC